jgi:tRNA modification GTPase
MYNTLDTIAAIATAPGESALAIVRLSGPRALEIVEKLLGRTKLENKKAVYGRLYGANGNQVDEVVVIFYQKPHGYTAEDMVEIVCHGGYVISNQILALLCQNGARLAEPGEFTLRAFLNGRIDLTEAEAVDTIIRAKTEKAKELALGNLEGKLQKRLICAQNRLLELITILEAQIDFNDDEVNKLPHSEANNRMREVRDIVDELVSTYDVGRLAEGRVQVAIVGAPNVGKSTLFNALLKDNRAIVTDTPGTTRDYLSEYVNIGGYPVILTDTAGIRQTESDIESIGIDRAREIIRQSGLCLFLLDGSRNPGDDDKEIFKELRNYQYILVVNKIDEALNNGDNQREAFGGNPIPISVKTGVGVDALIEAITHRIISSQDLKDDGVLMSQRQYDCAIKARAVIDESSEALHRNEPDEVIASLLRESLNCLGELVGKITSEDILNQIFGKFCIGK